MPSHDRIILRFSLQEFEQRRKLVGTGPQAAGRRRTLADTGKAMGVSGPSFPSCNQPTPRQTHTETYTSLLNGISGNSYARSLGRISANALRILPE